MERKIKLWAIYGLAAMAATSSLAQQGHRSALTLHQCLREALGRNPELEAQRYELSASTDAIWKAQSALFPQITGDILTQTLNGSSTGPFSVLNLANADEGSSGRSQGRTKASFDTVGAFSVRLSYGLFQNGSIMGLNDAPAVVAARSARTRQEWTYRLSEQEVEYKLTTAFYEAVSHQQQLEVDKSKVALSKERLEIIKAELQLDLKSQGDVDLAQAQLAADQQALLSSQHQAWQSRALLGSLIGRRNDPLSNLDTSEPRIPSAPALPALMESVTQAHPAIGIQQTRIDSARQDWRLARSDMLPTVKLESGYTEATDFQGANADLFIVGVRVDVPIFDFGHRQAATRETRKKMLAEQARMAEVEDNLRATLIAAVGTLHQIESKLANLQRDYIAAKNKATLVETQRELGMITQIAVVDARRELITVTEALNLQKLAQRLQYARLQNVTGGLWKWQR